MNRAFVREADGDEVVEPLYERQHGDLKLHHAFWRTWIESGRLQPRILGGNFDGNYSAAV